MSYVSTHSVVESDLPITNTELEEWIDTWLEEQGRRPIFSDAIDHYDTMSMSLTMWCAMHPYVNMIISGTGDTVWFEYYHGTHSREVTPRLEDLLNFPEDNEL